MRVNLVGHPFLLRRTTQGNAGNTIQWKPVIQSPTGHESLKLLTGLYEQGSVKFHEWSILLNFKSHLDRHQSNCEIIY